MSVIERTKAKNVVHPRISSGIFAVDCAIGGGWPLGKPILVVGMESYGKSLLAYKAIASAQRKGKLAVLVDAENSFDPEWGKLLGIDVEALVHCIPDNAQDAYNILIEVAQNPDKYGIGVVDSIEACIPEKEEEGNIDDYNIGTKAKLTNAYFRKLTTTLNKLKDNRQKPVIMHINQYRENPGVMMGSNLTIPGGLGQRFMSSIIVSMKSPNVADDKLKTHGVATINGVTKKNKTFAPKKNFSFDIGLKDTDSLQIGQIANESSVFSVIKNGCLDKKDGKYYLFKEEYRIQRDVLIRMEQEPDFYEKCRILAVETLKNG